MKQPTTKQVKVYAVLESVVTLDCSHDELNEYCRQNKLTGNITVNYSQGGVTNIVTKEIIPLTMKQLDAICNGDN